MGAGARAALTSAWAARRELYGRKGGHGPMYGSAEEYLQLVQQVRAGWEVEGFF